VQTTVLPPMLETVRWRRISCPAAQSGDGGLSKCTLGEKCHAGEGALSVEMLL